jgi:hypothetical protein
VEPWELYEPVSDRAHNSHGKRLCLESTTRRRESWNALCGERGHCLVEPWGLCEPVSDRAHGGIIVQQSTTSAVTLATRELECPLWQEGHYLVELGLTTRLIIVQYSTARRRDARVGMPAHR